jgi:hypothetical protein
MANSASVFDAGLPVSNGGFDPNVSVGMEVLPDDMTLDEYVEAGDRDLKQAVVVGVIEGGVTGSDELIDRSRSRTLDRPQCRLWADDLAATAAS